MVNIFRYSPPVAKLDRNFSLKMKIQSFALFYILFGVVSFSAAEFKSFRKPDFGYAAFRRFQNSKLNANDTTLLYVDNVRQCAFGCSLNLNCQSFNMAKQPVQSGQKYVCELLPTDMFNNSSNFENSNPNFLHYTMQVRVCRPLSHSPFFSVAKTLITIQFF